MGTNLIALTGDDEVAIAAAARLLDLHGYDVVDPNLPLRDALYEVDPLIGSERSLAGLVDAHGWAVATHRIHGPEISRLLRTLRETVCSVAGPTVWVDALVRELEASGGFPVEGGPRRVVLAGVADTEVARWAQDVGGQVWRVGPGASAAPKCDVDLSCHPRALAAKVEARLAGLVMAAA